MTVEVMPHFSVTATVIVYAYLLESFVGQGRQYPESGLLPVSNPLGTAKDLCKAYELFKIENAVMCMSLAAFSHPPQLTVRVNSTSELVESYFGIEKYDPDPIT